MLDAITIGVTGVIAGLATWMAVGLLVRRQWRLDDLASIGFASPRWATFFGVTLLVAVAALIVGWRMKPIGIAAIVSIKVAYILMLIGYRRAQTPRRRDAATLAMALHSAVAVAVILAW